MNQVLSQFNQGYLAYGLLRRSDMPNKSADFKAGYEKTEKNFHE